MLHHQWIIHLQLRRGTDKRDSWLAHFCLPMIQQDTHCVEHLSVDFHNVIIPDELIGYFVWGEGSAKFVLL